MNSQAASLLGLPDASPSESPPRRAPATSGASAGLTRFVAATALAVGLAWLATRSFGLQATSRAGYWLGVLGGTAMLVVFLYPLRKRLAFMRRWGAARPWFVLHMTCGIGGPLIVLMHSGFHVGSINGGVAMTSMLIVAASGIVGRFFYVRIHQGLSGVQWTLAELQTLVGASDAQVHSRLAFAPGVEERLHAFHRRQSAAATAAARIAAFVFAGLRARATRAGCRRELRIALEARAAAAGWNRSQVQRAFAKSARLVDDYLHAVRRATQLSAYERLFSWWHVLHLPLVWLLVASALVHVVAVHAY